ncbi:PLC-like phosphodiesterase [Exidia glandulosa HHB12029]|uniref:PLC-like phosphodiesterase n=1 Tax=Exidia glandulosa HHB12029 TaxID=1314781 RepID=A0A165QJS0_EXIGL|nr:PLC-like phosphodiesterase [Exidia glandulosa HHB12029]
MRLLTVFSSSAALLPFVAASIPLLAPCATLDRAAIPCVAGAACIAVNGTVSQCLPASRSAMRDARADRRELEALEKRTGEGGQVNLINGTPFKWKRTYVHGYQMNGWNDHWPTEVAPYSVASVYVEFKTGFLVKTGDDGGEVSYNLDGTPATFQLQAKGKGGFHIDAVLTDMSTVGNDRGKTIGLGWRHDGAVNFALAGTDAGRLVSNSPPQNWMQASLDAFKDVPLGKFVLPASHDSGMSKLDGKTIGATPCNTLTQTKPIRDQLAAGARYFDIRPVISAGNFKTGHYSKIDAIKSWQGGNGQSIQEIIDDLNGFTKDKAEVVILNFSHDLNTDVGNSDYRPLNQDEWNNLYRQLAGINNLYTSPNADTDLTTLSLNTLIGGGKSAVILVFQPDAHDITLDGRQGKGFFWYGQVNAWNSYSDSDDLNSMANDQIKKMHDQSGGYFLLSWTLTQKAAGALLCPAEPSILDLAQKANDAIFTQVLGAASKDAYPKLLYIDKFEDSNMIPLALAINYKVR